MRTDLDEVYRDLRPYAFAIAYRMLGSLGPLSPVGSRHNTGDTTSGDRTTSTAQDHRDR